MARDLSASRLIFHGPLITPQSPYLTQYLPHALICIENGIIQWIEEDIITDEQSDAALAARGLQGSDIIKLQRAEFLLPGFVDTHTVCPVYYRVENCWTMYTYYRQHAPQFPNLGR